MIRVGIRRLFRLALHRDADAKRDVADEVRLHLDLRADQLMAEGYSPEDARAEAERRFAASSAERTALAARASHREATFRWRECAESSAQDIGYVLRGLRRSPGFTATVVVTLALGLGANAALFSVLDRMFLQAPAGVHDPDNVRRVYRDDSRPGTDASATAPAATVSVFSYPMIRAMQGALPPEAVLAGYRTTTEVPLGRGDDSPRGVLTYVVGDYFRAAGVAMASGRPFLPAEYRAEGLAPVAVLSYKLATQRFGSADAAVEKTIDLGLRRFTVVGVAAEGFRGTDLDASDVWAPLNTRLAWSKPDTAWLHRNNTLFIAALVRAPGDTAFARAQSALTASMGDIAVFRQPAPMRFRPIRQALSSEFMRNEQRIATRLGGVALLILLIACANVANILLARAVVRRREIGIRLALGVSRGRLVRQLLTESVVLAIGSGIGALLTAAWCAAALRATLLPSIHWGTAAIGWRGAAFAAVTAVIAGLAAGLAPALHATRTHLADSLRGGSRDGTAHRSRLRNGLLVAQVALSVVLLVGAGLFVRSLQHVEALDIGYDEDQIAFAGVSPPRQFGSETPPNVSPAIVSQTLTDAAARIAHTPGVENVAFTENTPMWAFSFVDHFLPGRDSLPTSKGTETIVSFVSPGFFATMGVSLTEGRDFADGDRVGAEPVIVVNRAMAAAFWPGERAVGKCLILHRRADPCRRVIGVVSNAHYSGIIERPSLQFYVPLLQEGDDGRAGYAATLEIRSAPGRLASVMDAVRGDLERSAPPGTRAWIRTLRDQLDPQLRTWRLGARLFSLAGLLALLVAAVGIYGNISYSVSQRTHEMGVRIALGAQAANIVRLVLGEGLRVISVGILCGIILVIAGGQLVAAMLYGVTPRDPLVLGAIITVLVVTATVASLGPARRATRVDPIDSLRSD